MKKHKFNELRFYIVFFDIFLLVSNFIVEGIFHQEETNSLKIEIGRKIYEAENINSR
jgi:hypothetical protein